MSDDLSPMRMLAHEQEFTFVVDGLKPATFLVSEFTATEQLNRPYEVHLTLLSKDDRIALGKVIGKPGVLSSRTASGLRHMHGLVAEIQAAGRSRTLARYRVTLVPRLWLLSKRRDSRIFQAISTPELLSQVFGAVGISGSALVQRLNREYKPRDYCVQYRETDLDFVSRLMEEEGICYSFVHSASDHQLVISDDAVTHEDVQPALVRFLPATLSGGAGQHIEQLALSRSIQPGKATLRDFSFKGPSENLEVSVEYDGAGSSVDEDPGETNADLEFYDYPGEYVEKGLGAELVRLRMELHQVQRFRVEGRSTARRLCPGFKMTVSGHARGGLNRSYLLTSVQHHGTQPTPDNPDDERREHTYSNTFTAIPSDLSFRPSLDTSRPIISGLQTAKVTGPPGEEIHTDEFGRVKVLFHWDRAGRTDDNSSCWVRVSHPSAGAGFGQLILPRVGQEVIVQFLEGDPDRPVVTGRLYNAEQAPPSALPAGKACSSVKSSTYPGGGGYNELTFDDTAGAEKMIMHGQKDAAVTIGNDSATSVGNNETHSVAADRTASVGGNETCSVEGNRTASVTGNEDTSVTGNRSVSVTGNETRSVTGNQTESVTGNRDASVTGNQTESITGNSTVTVSGGKASLDVTGVYSVSASVTTKMHAGTDASFDAGSTMDLSSATVTVVGSTKVAINSDSEVVITVGGSSISLKPAEISLSSTTINVSAATLNLSGDTVNMNGTGTVNIGAPAINSNASGKNSITGATISLN